MIVKVDQYPDHRRGRKLDKAGLGNMERTLDTMDAVKRKNSEHEIQGNEFLIERKRKNRTTDSHRYFDSQSCVNSRR